MITKEKMNTLTFTSETWEPHIERGHEDTVFRLSKGDLPLSDDMKQVKLRLKMKDYFKQRLDNKYDTVWQKCCINQNTIKKIIGSGDRGVTRRVLAKFCIGIEATLEEADELMTLQGHHLDDSVKLDVILMDSLKDGIDIDEYYDRCLNEYDFDPDKA